MNILGIGGYSHDSAAALVCDGRLVAAVAEERLSRVKHQGGPPLLAAAWCLEHAGLAPGDIGHVCAYMRPGLRLAKRLPYRLGTALRHPLYSAAYGAYECLHNARYIADMRALAGPRTRLHFMEHHPAHAASAFLVSPYDEAALLTVDYVGEFGTTWGGHGRGTDLRPLFQIDYPHSLGVFYSALTDYLGFLRASDEYKVMGLASYGEPAYLDEFRRIVRVTPGEGYRLDLDWFACHRVPGSRLGYFSRRFLERFGPARKKDEPITDRHRDMAASAQRVLEEACLALAERVHKATGSKTLCMAGGVALNCSMNGRLQRESPFDRIFIQPAAGDDGIAVGGALQLHHRLTGAPRSFVMEHAHWGPGYGDDEIKAALERMGVPFRRCADIAADAAALIAEGKIVGWFQGRMEFGPRALGARSILADPTRPDMQDILNARVKHREEFRPFAPSVLAERAHEFFDGRGDSPFMLFVHNVKEAVRDRIPAVTHIDGTARVQTVARDVNPLYHRLIRRFDRLRGVPLVVNTSFNVMGEPIVNTPEDAIRCFQGTGIDALAIGAFLIEK